jgi:hypothetical protein
MCHIEIHVTLGKWDGIVMSLFMLKRHTGRSGGTALFIVHLGTRWTLSGQLQALAALP